ARHRGPRDDSRVCGALSAPRGMAWAASGEDRGVTRACAVRVPCTPARHLPTHEESTRVTSDADTPPWLDWPDGLRILDSACLWHRWPPWCELCTRQPSLSLTPCLPHNCLARTCSHTLSSAVPRGDTSCGRITRQWVEHVSRRVFVSWGQAGQEVCMVR